MSAKIYNANITADAILKQKTISAFGFYYAFDDNCDGWAKVTVDAEQAPTDIKTYLEGNVSIFSYPVASNVTKLTDYALASFPNIDSVYLFKNDDLVELTAHSFDNLSLLESVYVPDTLFDSYVATYPQYEDLFKKIVTTMDLVVPTFEGVTKLTKQIFSDLVGMLESANKNTIERVVVPSQYTELETECFEAISQLSICDTIVLEAITSAEADFMKGNTNIAYIDIQNSNFTLQGVADSTGTANFKWLTPIAYMHDYIYQQYVKDYYITGYAGITSGQPMPSREEYGYWKWYSSPTTTDDTYLGDSETYPTATYTGKSYAFLIIDTLMLTGTGALTSQIVENAINSIDTEISPLSQITKVFIGSGFTSVNNGIFNNIVNTLTNLNTYDFSNFTGTNYRNLKDLDNNVRNANYQIHTLITRSKRVVIGPYNDMALCIKNYYLYPTSDSYNIGQSCHSGLEKMEFLGNGTSVSTYYFNQNGQSSNLVIKFPEALQSNITQSSGATNKNIKTVGKIWFRSDFVPEPVNNVFENSLSGKLYFKANKLVEALEKWSTFTCDKIGYLDYTDAVPTFEGYTATWYSDEDCTTTIEPSAFVIGNRYFVKLTAI